MQKVQRRVRLTVFCDAVENLAVRVHFYMPRAVLFRYARVSERCWAGLDVHQRSVGRTRVDLDRGRPEDGDECQRRRVDGKRELDAVRAVALQSVLVLGLYPERKTAHQRLPSLIGSIPLVLFDK
jgi:hypothetical protein